MNATRHHFSPAYSKLIGTPYNEKNCWDIVKEFYELEFKVQLKKYYDVAPHERKDRENLICASKGDFYRVTSDFKFGDILLIKILGVESHIGVYLGRGLFLHTSQRSGCVIDRVAKWDKVITGYYRLKIEAA